MAFSTSKDTGNSVVHLTGARSPHAALSDPSPPASTGSRTSAENQEQRLQEHLLETMHLTRLTGLPEARLGGYCLSPAAIRDFFLFFRFFVWLSKNQMETGFLFKRWHILMDKQIIIDEISCVTSGKLLRYLLE